MYLRILTFSVTLLSLIGCSSPRDLPPEQQPSRFIEDTEKNRRARELDQFVRANITSVGIRSLGYLSIRGHDFEPQVRRLAQRLGAAYVGPISDADFPPDFFVAYDVDFEGSRTGSSNFKNLTLTANLVQTVAQEQGQRIVGISKQAGPCIVTGDSVRLYTCDELPGMMAEAALYSFAHP